MVGPSQNHSQNGKHGLVDGPEIGPRILPKEIVTQMEVGIKIAFQGFPFEAAVEGGLVQIAGTYITSKAVVGAEIVPVDHQAGIQQFLADPGLGIRPRLGSLPK